MSTAIETNEPAAHTERALNPIEKLSQFLKDTRQEMHKVTTPSRAEVQSTTIVVLVCVFLFAGYFFLVDFILGKTLDKFLFHVTR
jgi:preprotein translocase subunit SecE